MAMLPLHNRFRSSNHSFKALKGAEEDIIRSIAEAADVPELQEVLVRLNSRNSGVFTVGCEKII
jgi:spore coat polysaccharide biosynthesis protein SpsF (cytidylyltransferase family)